MPLHRIQPKTNPAINPIWEYQADDRLRALYATYKDAFQVPWVAVAVLALARYQSFLECWWQGLGGVVTSRAYVKSARELRAQVEAAVARLDPPPIAGRLRALGYTARELTEIRDMIEVFSHGNFIQIPALFSTAYLLAGQRFKGGCDIQERFVGRHAPHAQTPLVLIEPHHASPDTRDVYADVMARLDLPFVNTDYRALSRWPSYFKLAWGDLRAVIDAPAYTALTQTTHDSIFDVVANLHNPTDLTPEHICEAANKDASVAELLEVSGVFVHLLPGLVANVAYFRHQLLPG